MIALLSRCSFQNRGLNEFRLFQALARRALKQDCVAVRLPNGCQFDAPGSMQAKKDSARLPAANQNPFRDLKSAELQFVLLANFVMDVSSKFFQVVKLER